MAGLRQMFQLNAIQDFLKQKVDSIEQKTIEALQYEGEIFINKARATGNYKDRTGNLRSSIGYMILKDGQPIKSNFQGSKEDGRAKAREAAIDVATQYPNGYVLIGVAGMGYAAAVESLGFDVITGSAPEDNDIKELLNAIKP